MTWPLYLLIGQCMLFLLWAAGPDAIRDPGGYQDSWRPAKDKLQHAGIAAVLTTLAILIGCQPAVAALVTVFLGFEWEVAQRYPRTLYPSGVPGDFSWYDLGYDALGAVLAAVLCTLL